MSVPVNVFVALAVASIPPQEPAERSNVSIEKLFEESDVVALACLKKGDATILREPIVAYDAVVIEAFKGTQQESRLFFGPHAGLEIGRRYFVFLSNGGDNFRELLASERTWPDAEPLPFLRMFRRRSVFLVESARGFGCPGFRHSRRDEAVLVPSPEIVLPPEMGFVRDERFRGGTGYSRIGKDVFLEYLRGLRDALQK